MGRITLVCTTHVENGRCNENELIRILDLVSPEVIFEEIRPSDFDAHYSESARYTLEMQAISKYLKVNPVRQVPVDDYVIPEKFRRDMDILFDYVESRSVEYSTVMTKSNQMTFDIGFRYLNSPEFMALRKDADELFEKAIAMSGSDDLRKLLSMWNYQLRRREDSMLENIYDFCRKSPFTKGVFLVGAGHMSSIVEGIKSRVKNEANLVDWETWNVL